MYHVMFFVYYWYFSRKPVKSVDFHSYVKDLERDSGLLFAAEYEVRVNHAV